MKLFFAGAWTSDFMTIADIAGVKRQLLSFHYMPKLVKSKKIKMIDYFGKHKELFVDSGAYSAFTQGVKIDIYDYIDFLEFHKPELYANLDDIADWEQTLKNQKIMEAEGLNPLPVWHAKEPMNVLRDYVGSYDIVGVGFGTLKSNDDKKQLAKTVSQEFPKQKFHFFAITHLDFLAEYDIFSADSTGWLLRASKFATIDTPMGYVHFGKGYDSAKETHVDRMDQKQLAQFDAYLQAFGLSADLLRTTYKRSFILRIYYQARFFLLYEQACNSLERKDGKLAPQMLDKFFREKAKEWTR